MQGRGKNGPGKRKTTLPGMRKKCYLLKDESKKIKMVFCEIGFGDKTTADVCGPALADRFCGFLRLSCAVMTRRLKFYGLI